MTWNWQQKDWPQFTYDEGLLRPLEDRFLQSGGIWKGSFRHLPGGEQDQLRIELLSTEALQTAHIEGEILDRDSVQVSIRRLFGLQSDPRRVGPAEYGIAEMMVDVYRTFDEPLTAHRLFEWHRMITQGRRDIMDMGRYRTHAEAMQIVSGPLERPRVHYEAPPSSQVPREMLAFFDWVDRSHPSGSHPLPGLARSGIAHLHFESIHPFEDGNGRIGRAISEKMLSQALGQPSLIMLADTINRKRKAYYAALEAASSQIELTEWLVWFAEMVLEAQQRTLQHLDFLIAKSKLFTRLHGALNARQEKALLRLFRAGPDGFQGGLSASNYQSITGASAASATRDLQDLVEKQALYRQGERKSTRYFLV